jgi:hypothetical protein
LLKEIQHLKQEAQQKRWSCAIQPADGFKWYLSLPGSVFFIPLPMPQQLREGGTLHSTTVYNGLAQSYARLSFILNDMSAPTMLKSETSNKIDDHLCQAVIYH